MTIEISSLRVSAEMDASAYTAGANAKIAADKAMIASGQGVAASVTQTDTKISQAGDVLSRLSRQYVDGYANAQRFNAALNQLSSGIDRGKISMEQAEVILGGMSAKFGLMGDAAQFAARGQTQFAAAITAANAKLAQQRQLTPVNQNQGGLARFGSLNATSQFQDIAITSAMGQSPFTIALQQGTQLGMALEQQLGDQGAKGLVKSLGAAFMGLVTPINLIAIGLTGAVAVAIQFGSKLLPQVKSLKDATEEQRKAVTDLAEAYGAASLKADDFYKKSIIASESEARRTTEDLRKASGVANVGAFSELINPFAAGQGFTVARDKFAAFNTPIVELLKTVRSGQPDFVAFEKSIAGVVDQNPGLQKTSDEILKIVAAATAAAAQLFHTAEVIKDINRSSVGNFDRTQQAGRDQSVMSQRFGDDPLDKLREQKRQTDIGYVQAQDERNRSLDRTLASEKLDLDLIGKTTAEAESRRQAFQLESQVREEAARRNITSETEFQKVYGSEIALIRQKAAELGKAMALEQARSTIFDQSQDIEMQRKELELVGQNSLARNASIASLKAEQEIRKLGIPLYGAEAEAIRKNTAELSSLAEAQAKANLASDLAFERRQMFRSPDDQQVASRLQSAGLPDDLNSTEAAAIRANQALGHMKDTWNSIFDVANKGVDSLVDSLFNGGKDFGEVLKGVGRDFAKLMFDLALTNPLKNWLTGSNLPSIADLGIFGSGASSGKGGGFGGVLGGLLGAQKAVASMQVQAASVFINGSPIGGGLPGIPGVPGAANDNSGGGIFGWIKSLFGGSGGASLAQNAIQSRIDGAFGTTASNLGGIFSPAGGYASVLGSTSGGSMSSFASAIKMIESAGSGGYSALGPMLKNGNQALGAYQIMSSNLPSWSKEAFGSAMSPSQFMSSPAAQDTIFQQQFGKLLSKFGNSNDAASAWFTGGPLSTRGGAMDILGTSGSQYVDKFNAALEKVTGSAGSLAGAASTATQGLGTLGSGLGNLGSALNQFPAAPTGGGGGGLFSGIGSWFSGLFGGGGGAALSPAATAALGNGAYTGLFHEGGIAGYSGAKRYVSDMGIFKHAQRLHSGGFAGFAPDEVPAVLRRGEPVFKSMEHARQVVGGKDNGNIEAIVNALANKLKLNVKNINVFDPSVVGDYTRTDDGEQAIRNVMRRTGSGRGL